MLLIEDDTTLRKQVRFSLEKKYSILEAGSRSEAIDVLKGSAVDVAVLDLGLPPSENTPDEGLKLADYILQNSAAKIIVLTGQKTERAAIESIRLGVFDYVMKPVSMQNLILSIERALLFSKTEEKIGTDGTRKISVNVKIGDGLQCLREEAQKNLILKVLKENDFNVYKTAKILGIKRENLYYFINKFGWKRDDNGQ